MVHKNYISVRVRSDNAVPDGEQSGTEALLFFKEKLFHFLALHGIQMKSHNTAHLAMRIPGNDFSVSPNPHPLTIFAEKAEVHVEPLEPLGGTDRFYRLHAPGKILRVQPLLPLLKVVRKSIRLVPRHGVVPGIEIDLSGEEIPIPEPRIGCIQSKIQPFQAFSKSLILFRSVGMELLLLLGDIPEKQRKILFLRGIKTIAVPLLQGFGVVFSLPNSSFKGHCSSLLKPSGKGLGALPEDPAPPLALQIFGGAFHHLFEGGIYLHKLPVFRPSLRIPKYFMAGIGHGHMP